LGVPITPIVWPFASIAVTWALVSIPSANPGDDRKTILHEFPGQSASPIYTLLGGLARADNRDCRGADQLPITLKIEEFNGMRRIAPLVRVLEFSMNPDVEPSIGSSTNLFKHTPCRRARLFAGNKVRRSSTRENQRSVPPGS
jgi:hypothetical protein